MKKFVIPLLTVAVVVSIVFAGCVPTAPPPVAPPPVAPPEVVTDPLGVPLPPEIVGLVDAEVVYMNPWPGRDFALKPDGTQYRITFAQTWMGDDYQYAAKGIARNHFENAGAIYVGLDALHSVDIHIGQIEDIIATRSADVIMMQPTEEYLMVAVTEAAEMAGIPVFCFVDASRTDMLTFWSGYLYEDPELGIGVVGKEFVRIAEERGEPINILEIWGNRGWATSVNRHLGFHAGIAEHPLITVIESVDTVGEPEAMVAVTMDNFSVHPELNGLFSHWGDATAFVTGLKAVDRWYPVGHEKHVAVIPQDVDIVAAEQVRAGYFAGLGSTSPWQQVDVLVKAVLNHVVCGLPLDPDRVPIPVFMITRENIGKEFLYGGTLVFTDMPFAEWGKWPVLDTTEVGLPILSKADRMELMGY